MKNVTKFLKVIVLGALAVSLSNCDDNDDNVVIPTTANTIAKIASSNDDFSTLVTALNKVGLTQTLNSPGNYTVFAPTNEAFNTFLADNGFASLNDVPEALLKEVLLNHVVNGEFFSSALTTSYVKTLAKGDASATNTLSLYVDTSSGVKLNGVATVTTANLNASNGVVHVVDAVIGLPTIVTHATANPNFSILVAALTRTDQLDQNFVSTLSGTANSPFTVFAPTNTAFSNTGSPQGLLQEFGWASLNDVPESVLEKTLKYHVVLNANVLSDNLPTTPVTTYLGQTFTISTTGGGPVITDYNSRISNIVATDVQCTNGVIHVLNKVIVPNLD